MEVDVVSITIIITILLISSSLHEAMHAFTSFKLGDATAAQQGRLSFNPLRHIDPFLSIVLPLLLWVSGLPVFGGAKPVPFNPYSVRWGVKGAALVGASGPLTNLALAIAVGLPLRFAQLSQSMTEVLGLFVVINLGFFIFNSLPIPPLDGSRVLYAFVPESVQAFMRQIEQQGILLIFAIVVIFSNLLSGITGTVVTWLFELITGTELLI
jgi:Zn-dependent protease